MGSMKDLLGDHPPAWATPSYPATPGYTNATTSKAAAERIAPRAGTIRADCLDAFRHDASVAASLDRRAGLTADECAALVKKSVLTVRPRVAELVEMGWLQDSGQVRKNESGVAAIVWELTPESST